MALIITDMSTEIRQLGGTRSVRFLITDTEKFEEIEIDIRGGSMTEKHRPLLGYERNQHFDDREDLKKALQEVQRELLTARLELAVERDKKGTPVEAGEGDYMMIVSPAFQNLLAAALDDAGLVVQEIDTDVFKVTTDDDDEPEEKPAEIFWCAGHQFNEHPPEPMIDYGLELQCPICGNTRPNHKR